MTPLLGPGLNRFYIASRLEAADRVRRMAALLQRQGFIQTYDWTVHGSVQSKGEREIQRIASLEFKGVAECNLFICLLPGGRGTHTELGMALALGKPVVLVGPRADEDGRHCAFYHLPGIFHFPTDSGALIWLLEGGGAEAAQ